MWLKPADSSWVSDAMSGQAALTIVVTRVNRW